MSNSSALERLAERAGILPAYDDVFGRTHEASEATLRAVLAVLGIEVEDEADAARALERLDELERQRVLEPVYVMKPGARIAITCTFAKNDLAADVRWMLEREEGAVVRGTLAVDSLEPVEPSETNASGYVRRVLVLPGRLSLGYHRLSLEIAGMRHTTTLIAAPEACYLPPELERGRVWGLAVQVYSLHSARDWGAGDYTDLRTVCDVVREAGGAAVAVNPLHWLAHGEASPYGPASRELLNWTYLDATALDGAIASDSPAIDIARARAAAYVEYEIVREAIARAARLAFDRFTLTPRDARHEAFEAFVARGGERLREAATFATLAEHFRLAIGESDWRKWPEPYRDPVSDEVVAFARERTSDVAFFQYLQWQTDEQLVQVARACQGMPIGLYRDLAVGTHLGGFDTWRAGNALCGAASAGAPPDLLNRTGQSWGVAPFDPTALREAAYAPFAELIRANVAHAGALRIDHVIGLQRLWFVPDGFAASEGAYVTYRLDELLSVLALESVRGRFVVVGEDLGTVPPGFRERLERARVFSYRVLQFEYDDNAFLPPSDYPELALVATGTHDLPTMAAYWSGDDLELRTRVGALAPDAVEAERETRDRQLALLRAAFASAGLSADDALSGAAIGRIANEFLAQTPSRLLMVQLEDVLGETEQINVPATTHEHPNWRRRNAVDVESLRTDERFLALVAAIRASRSSLASTSRS